MEKTNLAQTRGAPTCMLTHPRSHTDRPEGPARHKPSVRVLRAAQDAKTEFANRTEIRTRNDLKTKALIATYAWDIARQAPTQKSMPLK